MGNNLFNYYLILQYAYFVKKLGILKLLLLLYVTITYIPSFAQNTNLTKNTNQRSWTTSDPFKTDVFIENFGQFDNWVKATEPVKFAINNSDKIFFTQHGLIYRVEKIIKNSDEEIEEFKNNDGKELSENSELYFIYQNWEGSNPDSQIETSQQGEGYYTFGEKGYENIRAKGFKKITYKNLYPFIDVEYIIPKMGGIKYSIILHPGADLSKVKMKYSGDIEKISTNIAGDIVISTEVGEIIDHAPKSYIEDNKANIISHFELKENVVSFQILNYNSKFLATIDPWTTTPTSLTSNNVGYDVTSDNSGNVFVSGGTMPFKISKYSSNGIFQWSYSCPSGWSSNGNGGMIYSKFCILPNSGTIFLAEACSPNSRIMKISNSGILLNTANTPGTIEEIHVMFYNKCTGKLAGFGGGYNYNLKLISDTNLTNSSVQNFNNYTSLRNDVASVKMDNNGDFYALMSSLDNPSSNHLQKSLISSNYLPPCAFDIFTGYNFYEIYHYGIPGLNSICIRANAIDLNSSYLYSYDGKTLKAWNKANGLLMGSIIVNASYSGGRNRTHEGIAVDDCNNIWVGGTNTIHNYYFNGSIFIAGTSISTNITGEVYDISLNPSLGFIVACGNGFLTTFNIPSCGAALSIINSTSLTCTGGTASVTVSGGNGPYTYHWSNGDTTNNIIVASGTYYLTVTDNSCILHMVTDSVVVSANFPPTPTIGSNGPLCSGTTLHLTSSGGSTYLWSGPNSFTSTQQNPSISSITTNATGVYSVTVTDVNSCTAITTTTVFINPPPVATASNNGPVCTGASLTLSSSGGPSYLWSGPGGFTSNVQNPNITNVTSANGGVYTVTITNSNNCSATATTTVVVKPKPTTPVVSSNSPVCAGSALNLISTSTSGSTYQWSGPGGFTSSVQNPVITNTTTSNSGTYSVIATLNGCSSGAGTTTVTINPSPNSAFTIPTSVCQNSNVTITATSQSNVTYNWNFGGGTIISGSGAGPYHVSWANTGSPTVTLTVTSTISPFCSTTTSHIITVVPSTVVGCCVNPIPNAGTDATVCGLSYTMQGSLPLAGNTGVWLQVSGPGTSVFGMNTVNTSAVTVSQQGQYVFQWMQFSGNCAGTDSVTIKFVAQPNANAGADKDTCGLTCHLHAIPSAGTGLWSGGSGTFGTPASATSSVSVSTYGIHNFIWTETNTLYSHTCTDKDTVAINFHQIPTTNAGTNAAVCGNSCFLHGSLPATGNTAQWSQIAGAGVSTFSNYQSNTSMVTVTSPGNYQYQWKEYNGFCYGTSTVTVTFIQIPIAYAGTDDSICGKTYSLHATPSVGTGNWTGTGTYLPNNSSPTASVTVPNNGVYTFIWTETNTISGTSCSDADSVKVNFRQIPTPDAGNNFTTCGQTANLHAIATFPGHWTGPSGALYYPGNTSPGGIVTILPYSSQTHNETFTWHETNGTCTGSDNVTITFMKAPHAEAGTGGSTCDSLFSLHSDTLGSGVVGGYWYTNSIIPGINVKPYNSVNATGSIHNVIPNIYGDSSYVNVYYYWEVQNTASCTSQDSVKVTYYQVPKAHAGPDDSICGKQYSLTGAYSIDESLGQWRVITKPISSANVNFVAASSPTSLVNISDYGTYTFEWREVNKHNSNCDSRDTVKIVFLNMPNINAGNDTSICGMYIHLNATSSGGTGSWYANTGGVSWWNQPNGSSGPNYASHSSTWARFSTQSDTVMFTWQEYNSLCVARDSMYVIFATPQPAVALVDAADSVSCGLNFHLFNAQTPNIGTGYWWDTVPNTHFYPYPAPGANNPNPDSAVVAYYGMHHFYWITHNGACRDTSKVVPIYFIHKPSANAGGHYHPGLFGVNSYIKTDTTCGYEYYLNAISTYGTGTWSSDDASNTWFNQHGRYFQTTSRYNDTVTTAILTYNANPNYRQLIWIEDDKGCTDADTLRLMFAPLPDGRFTSTMPSCKGDSSVLIASTDQYNANNFGIVHFYWTFDGFARFESDTVHFINKDTVVARWISGNSHIVRLVTVNKFNCYSGIFIDTVKEPPAFNPSKTVTPSTCHQPDGKIILHNHNNLYQFTWDNTFPANHIHDTVQSNLPNNYYVVMVYGESISPDAPAGTECLDSLKILVPDTGEIIATFDTLPFIDTITSVDPRTITFTNQTAGASTYQWLFYDKDGNKTGESDIENPTITFHQGVYKIVLIAKSRQNCVDTVSYQYLVVRGKSFIEVPNVFSPNGDGINDEFKIINRTLKDFHCTIFNRWGTKIFEWSDSSKGWDGKTNTGENAISGVYFYVVTGIGEDNINYVVKGSVELLRN